MQGAHQFIAIDFAKNGKISIAMWACALHDPIANLNLLVGYATSTWVGLAKRFCLGASHSLFRE
jgi:hypothetical protein